MAGRFTGDLVAAMSERKCTCRGFAGIVDADGKSMCGTTVPINEKCTYCIGHEAAAQELYGVAKGLAAMERCADSYDQLDNKEIWSKLSHALDRCREAGWKVEE